jgi:AraC family transcriptional regulator
MDHRLDIAKELLLRSLPIADIDLQYGFSDQSHLTRMFTNSIGMPPVVWRRRRRGAARFAQAQRCDPNRMGILPDSRPRP